MTLPGNHQRQRGAVLLMLLAILGASVLVTAGVLTGGVSAGAGDRLALSEQRVAALCFAADRAFRNAGAFPANLAALTGGAASCSLDLRSADPLGGGVDVAYAVTTGAGVTVTAAGPDRTLGTADDVSSTAGEGNAGRPATRNRLRILRAAFLRSGFMSDPGMTAAERAAMESALHAWAAARRAYTYADAAGQAALQSAMNIAATTITTLRSAYGLPAIPAAATGLGGLLAGLGLPDSLGTDGFGRVFDTGVAGFVSRGADGSPGTGDDL